MKSIEKHTPQDSASANQTISEADIDGLVKDLHTFQINHDPVTYESGINAVRCALIALGSHKNNTPLAIRAYTLARERLDELFAQAQNLELAQCA